VWRSCDKYGHRKTPFSCLTEATNAKGYYFKTLPAVGLHDHLNLKVTESQAYLDFGSFNPYIFSRNTHQKERLQRVKCWVFYQVPVHSGFLNFYAYK
jgi:hypothetical protein